MFASFLKLTWICRIFPELIHPPLFQSCLHLLLHMEPTFKQKRLFKQAMDRHFSCFAALQFSKLGSFAAIKKGCEKKMAFLFESQCNFERRICILGDQETIWKAFILLHFEQYLPASVNVHFFNDIFCYRNPTIRFRFMPTNLGSHSSHFSYLIRTIINTMPSILSISIYRVSH